MIFMGAHQNRALGQAATGTVDDTYDPADAVNGDPDDVVRVTAGSLVLDIPLDGGEVNAVIVANSNLGSAATADFSGLTTLNMPGKQPNGIALNGWKMLDTVSPSSTTLTITGTSPIIVGNVFVGRMTAISHFTGENRYPGDFPPDSPYEYRQVGIPNSGEYGGLWYSKGAQYRVLAGTLLLPRGSVDYLQDCFDASDNNSLPTVVVRDVNRSDEAMLVIWDRWSPRTRHKTVDLYTCDISLIELPRYKHPVA